jgi:hypothetical protein
MLRLYHVRSKDKGITEGESARGLGTDDRRSQQARGSVAAATVATLATVAGIERAAHTTLAAIAQEFEARGVRTRPVDRPWQPVQVSRLLAI